MSRDEDIRYAMLRELLERFEQALDRLDGIIDAMEEEVPDESDAAEPGNEAEPMGA